MGLASVVIAGCAETPRADRSANDQQTSQVAGPQARSADGGGSNVVRLNPDYWRAIEWVYAPVGGDDRTGGTWPPVDGMFSLWDGIPVRSTPGAEKWRTLVERYAWPVDEVLTVMQCESGGDPDAMNGTSVGLMQINTAAHPYTVEQMRDPEQNIAAAYAIWADSGWAPWSCRP